jgi:hypothetical protein
MMPRRTTTGWGLVFRIDRLRAIAALVLAYVFAGWLSPAQAQPVIPQDGVTERGWLSDPNGTLTPAEALSGVWTLYEGSLARGFTNSVTWIRLKIDPSRVGVGSFQSDHRLILRIWRVDRLDDPPITVGDKIAPAGLQQGLLNHAVVFNEVVTPIEVLLRLQTKGNHSMHIEAWRWDEASRLLTRDANLVTGYLVFTVMVII